MAAASSIEPTTSRKKVPRQEAGWSVLLGGHSQPYKWSEQLALEHAFLQGANKVSIGVGDMRFEVVFNIDVERRATSGCCTVGMQHGKAKERPVQRVPPSSSDALLVDAGRIATLIEATCVLEHWELLWQQTAALDDAKRNVQARRDAWVADLEAQLKHMTQKPLTGQKVALAGTFLLGDRPFVHKVINEVCGGDLPTYEKKAAERINANTNLLVVGCADEGGAEVAQAKEGLRTANQRRKAKKAPCKLVDEVALVEALSQGTVGEGSLPHALRQQAAAVAPRQLRHQLVRLALESAAWREVEEARPLNGLLVPPALSISLLSPISSVSPRARLPPPTPPPQPAQVCLTGVMIMSKSGGALQKGLPNTQDEVKALVERCGGVVMQARNNATA